MVLISERDLFFYIWDPIYLENEKRSYISNNYSAFKDVLRILENMNKLEQNIKIEIDLERIIENIHCY